MLDFPMIDDGPCTFAHEGQTFTNSGAYFARYDDGLVHGHAYVVPDPDYDGPQWRLPFHVTTWRSVYLGPAHLGKPYRSSFGDKRRSVATKINGVAMYGTLYENSTLVSFTEYRHPPACLARGDAR